MNESQKRSRTANFTRDEQMICLNIIKKYRHILECKKTDSVTWKDKEEVWNKIEVEFNSVLSSGTRRAKENLKTFYENKKKLTRKMVALQKKNITDTGGGKPSYKYDDYDPTIELTMSIVNKKTVEGLENKYDGDSTYVVSADPEIDEDIENDVINNSEEVILLSVDNDDDELENETVDWSNVKPTHLRTAVHRKLKPSAAVTTSATVQSCSEIEQNTEKPSWSSRRRPSTSATTTLARLYEDLVNKKMEISTIQLETLQSQRDHALATIKQEEAEFKLKSEREMELFNLQKQSILLDINIKKCQLQKLNSI